VDFGYRLACVVLLASLLAMPVQFLAAKIGIVTGRRRSYAAHAAAPQCGGTCGCRPN
jgi:Mn2+/Fe2+ NRAMP family transporter